MRLNKHLLSVVAKYYHNHNDVHFHQGGWWFWDECGLDHYGPYSSYDKAYSHLKQYVLWLGGKL